MASIQDVANASYRIGQDARELSGRMCATADSLRSKNDQLAVAIRGSRSGEDAVRQVTAAVQALLASSALLTSLDGDVKRFIADLTK